MNAMTPTDADIPPVNSVIFPCFGYFTAPETVFVARHCDEVVLALEEARKAVNAGRWVAGYLAYEAAPAFEPAFASHPPGEIPLVWLGVYAAPQPVPKLVSIGPAEVLPWKGAVDEMAYAAAFSEIRSRIAAGETYQVNYTFPLDAPAPGDSWSFFRALYAAQPVPHACYLDAGDHQVLSLSPELFFSLHDGELRTRPMKGTRKRGLYTGQDTAIAAELAASAKDRAENVMIVDMLRNDMARVAAPGSVRVERLFEVERYSTVWQMTSTIAARTQADVPEILAALFPSGSVTGAPKIQTSKIIRALEPMPRGVYCGAMGWWAPGGRAEFNVAIRTLTVHRARGTSRYHVGSGVTWEARPEGEYAECLDKAALLLAPPATEFTLFETLRLEGGQYTLLDEHLARMSDSAAFFLRPFDAAAARAALEGLARELVGLYRVRMVLQGDGSVALENFPLEAQPGPWRVALAKAPVRRDNVTLYHKTTERVIYDAARAAAPGMDDVLLYNEAGELTESTVANLGVVLEGRHFTPTRACGLLAGTLRARLLAEGRLEEAVLRQEDLQRAERVYLFNSVRGEISITLEA